jgi:hypothetical protein
MRVFKGGDDQTWCTAQVANARQAFKCSTPHRKARRDALGQDSGGTRAGQLEAEWQESWRSPAEILAHNIGTQVDM